MESKVKGEKGRGGNGILLVGERAGPSTPSTAWPPFQFSSPPPPPSARKLCAHLWQLQPPHFPLPNLPLQPFKHAAHQPTNSSRSSKRIAASVMQHRPSVESFPNSVSPSSSLEVAPYNPAITPSGSSGYTVKTSTELLKVLNGIWALEEQHASNVSLVKALETELDRSRAQIQELQLLKKKEQRIINVIIQSLRDELEDERKLRNNSESWRRKLTQELSEVKACFADALKELERERKARILLENLCDEFARGVQCLKHKHVVDHGEGPERLILRISEAWLEARMQMKPAGKSTIVDKLSLHIQTLLEAKRDIGSRKCELKDNGSHRRHSLESFPLNEAVSAPQGAKQCNELNKTANVRSRGARKGSKLVRSAYQGHGSSVQRWVSKLKSEDFETSNSSLKLGKESIEGKVTRSKTRMPAIV
ncbi:hypothetical protein V6N13_132012 [Hibiscus sabdariffa]|uniref:Uncharacterized protein n=1 Tax=Hibiscus sabdariffa TaxID=183260 RepID=A0ABR2NIT7_9ROSI